MTEHREAPQPRVDEHGYARCSSICGYYCGYGGSKQTGHCRFFATPLAVNPQLDLCEPAVRADAAELARLREANRNLRVANQDDRDKFVDELAILDRQLFDARAELAECDAERLRLLAAATTKVDCLIAVDEALDAAGIPRMNEQNQEMGAASRVNVLAARLARYE